MTTACRPNRQRHDGSSHGARRCATSDLAMSNLAASNLGDSGLTISGPAAVSVFPAASDAPKSGIAALTGEASPSEPVRLGESIDAALFGAAIWAEKSRGDWSARRFREGLVAVGR